MSKVAAEVQEQLKKEVKELLNEIILKLDSFQDIPQTTDEDYGRVTIGEPVLDEDGEDTYDDPVVNTATELAVIRAACKELAGRDCGVRLLEKYYTSTC